MAIRNPSYDKVLLTVSIKIYMKSRSVSLRNTVKKEYMVIIVIIFFVFVGKDATLVKNFESVNERIWA